MTEKKRLKAEIREGKLFLNDVEQKLEIEAFKTLRASVTGLSTFNGYNFYGDTPTRGCQIRGTGTIEDSIQVLGVDARTRKLDVSFRPVPIGEEEKFAWRAHIGWTDADWELRSSETWWLECYLPGDVYSEIEQEYRVGRLRALSVGVKAEMWAPWSPIPHADRTPWHILPNEHGSSAHAIGKVEALGWSDGRLPGDEDNYVEDEVAKPQSIPSAAGNAASPLAAIMTAGTAANERLAKTWAWGVPAVVILLAIIAAKM